MPTTPIQMRLTPEDRRKLGEIQERMGLPSLAAAVRYSVGRAYFQMTERISTPQKSRKKSENGA